VGVVAGPGGGPRAGDPAPVGPPLDALSERRLDDELRRFEG